MGKKTNLTHWEHCEAPICMYYGPESTVWYPSEEVCKKRPFTKVQKVQLRLNKMILKKGMQYLEDEAFTLDMLKNMDRVRQGIRGKRNRRGLWADKGRLPFVSQNI